MPVNITIPKGAFPGKHKGAVVVASNIGTGTVTLAKRVAIFYDIEVPLANEVNAASKSLRVAEANE